MYIVAGPIVIGNAFGYYGKDLPANTFAIVEDGEYTNGGYGPSSVNGKIYTSEEAAKAAMAEL